MAAGNAAQPVLTLEDVSKSYGASEVLSGVSLTVNPGEIVAVVGENGAGKSTLARIIAGVTEPDRGRMLLDGKPVTFRSPREGLGHGVAFLPQELAEVPDLSAGENVMMGRLPSRAGFTHVRWAKRLARAQARRLGISIDMDARMSTLRLAERQLVEIIKSVTRDARLILLDEPTASLSEAESEKLFDILHRLSDGGVGIIYISHRLDEVFRFSDRVDVLRNGQLVASTAPADTSMGGLIHHMLGKAAGSLAETAGQSVETKSEPVLTIHGWTDAGRLQLHDVSFEVRRGEVVGVYGLSGSGCELIAEGLAGLAHGELSGELTIDGREYPPFRSPRQAQLAGVSYVPPERKRDGLVLTLPVQANLSLAVLDQVSRLGLLQGSAERRLARGLQERLLIRSRSLTQLVAELSGGNQQKVLVGSRLASGARVYVLHEPTRGVDVGARVEIQRLMRDLARAGAAVLLISSDVEEAVIASDRLFVIREGRLATELSGVLKTQSAAIHAATEAGATLVA